MKVKAKKEMENRKRVEGELIREENPNLIILEFVTNAAKLLVDPNPLMVFVLAITNVANEDGETSHA